MATIDDLTAAVRKLSARVKELEGGSASELVAELVDNSDGRNQPSRHGFADACKESDAQLCDQLEREAVARLRTGTVAYRGPSVAAFRNDFSRLGATKLDELLSKYR